MNNIRVGEEGGLVWLSGVKVYYWDNDQLRLGEAIKKRLSFGHCSKEGGGSNGNQKF